MATDSTTANTIWTSLDIKDKNVISKDNFSRALDSLSIERKDIDFCSSRKINHIDFSKLTLKHFNVQIERHSGVPSYTGVNLESKIPRADGEKDIIQFAINSHQDCYAAIGSLIARPSYHSLSMRSFQFRKGAKVGQFAVLIANAPLYWMYHNITFGVTSSMRFDDAELLNAIMEFDAYVKEKLYITYSGPHKTDNHLR